MNRYDANAAPFYLCTGFHRSGTSLVANTLASNGVNLGDNLMGPSFANPNGHFEDIPAVNLHDQILHANGTDWRFYGEHTLKVTSFFQSKIQHYYEQRRQAQQRQPFIGLKDPRAVFLIDNWYQATSGNLKTLLVYRDWRYAISSLYKRHSRELLQFTNPIQHRKLDYQFWQHTELAARMWLASANSMLDWFSKHPQDTLLFEQQSFVSQQQALKKCAQDKGIEPQILDCKLFNQKLMQSSVPQSMLNMVPEHIRRLCTETQTKLNEVADVYSDEDICTEMVDPLALIVANDFNSEPVRTSESINLTTQINLSDLSWDDAIETLRSLPADQNFTIDWSELFGRTNINSSNYDALYVVAIKFKQWVVAENALHRAIAFKPYHYRYIHLGDMYMRRKIPDKAKQYYQMAQQLAPDNSAPLAKLSEVETFLNNLEDARNLLQQAEQLDPTKPAIKQARIRLEQKTKQLNSTSHDHSVIGSMHTISDYQQVVTAMSESFEQGKELDNYMVKTAFIMRNNKSWFLEGCEKLSVTARECLLDYLFRHLRKHWTENVLTTELTGKPNNEHSLVNLTVTESTLSPRIGVSIHVFHLQLLPELISFVNQLPHLHKLLITCPHELVNELSQVFGDHSLVEIIEVENRGRDILPWLSTADKLEDCDAVIKLHTKSTPHSSALCGWRLQLLWMLLGDKDNIRKILNEFVNKPTLGMVIPNFHPNIAKHINWGENRSMAEQLCNNLNITLPQDITIFPAGSMFWYRPTALSKLTSHPWSEADFPEESGQIDGTIMHAIERVLCVSAQQQGFDVEFSQAITWN
jgi:tetratricopeptide (TPR) repeat protein